MASLIDKSNQILTEKNNNLKPEYLKAGVTCLGVTGTLESGGSSDYNAKLVVTNGKITNYITEISENLDTSSVTSMTFMFQHCTNLTEIPLLNTSNVTDMSYMFSNCTNLQTIPLLDTSSVTNMQAMFGGCTNLITIPELNTSKVTNMTYMFSSCTNLSDESLNNVLQTCINATSYTKTKTLKDVGLTSEQATKCTTLSNYSAFTAAGWTTGY